MPLLAQKKYTGKFVFTPQWTAHAQFAGYYVAQEKGFYKAEGLDVDIVHPSVSETAMHRIQEAESHATTLPLCLAMEIMDKGVPLVNILQTSMNNSTVIVSRRGKNPLTQKGARVGIWHAGFGQVAICMSRKEHLNYQWIQFTSNFDLFIKGAIDATLAMSYNEYYQLKTAGQRIRKDQMLYLRDIGYNVPEDGLYVTKDYFRKHRTEVLKFAEASRKGWEWAADHPEETLEIVMQYIRQCNIPSNIFAQRWMLEECIRLLADPKTGKRTYRLDHQMFDHTSRILYKGSVIKKPISYQQITQP